jgi:hypothetical protein
MAFSFRLAHPFAFNSADDRPPIQFEDLLADGTIPLESHVMPTTVNIDGVSCTIQKLPDQTIQVSFAGAQFNSMHGPDTDGNCSYRVHPCQRNQYEFLNAQLNPAERETLSAKEGAAPERPWWSMGTGERAGVRE